MKLIRDNTPDIERGEVVTIRDNPIAQDLALRAKLMEEAAEVAASTSREEMVDELGDLTLIMGKIREKHNISILEVEEAVIRKIAKKGGFSRWLVLTYDPLDNKQKNPS